MIFTCMGGWCGQRDKCAHFHAKPLKHFTPAERLCGKREKPVLQEQKAPSIVYSMPLPPLAIPVATIQAGNSGWIDRVATAAVSS